MMVSTRGRYALRILIDLAEHATEEFVSLKAVSERQEISMKYMEAIVSSLTRAGLLKSRRGKTGGYQLSRAAADINVGEVLRLTEGSLAPVACMENGGCVECGRSASCLTLPLWQKLDQLVGDYLKGVSIQDLLDGTIKQ